MSFEIMKQAIHDRRSVRKYKDQVVLTEDILELMDCARYAPSDTNSQTYI